LLCAPGRVLLSVGDLIYAGWAQKPKTSHSLLPSQPQRSCAYGILHACALGMALWCGVDEKRTLVLYHDAEFEST
jgi:hypothetical protein